MKIRSKAQFFAMWEAGLLGNRTQLWHNPVEAYEWGANENKRLNLPVGKPEIGFRQIGKTGGGRWEKCGWARVLSVANRWSGHGFKFIMDDGAPDAYRTLQGEVCRTFRGLESYLSLGSNLPMRPDMAAGNMRTYGYAATARLLDCYMDPPSRDDLEALLDLYPDATIEFTCFSIGAGILGRNTIFWETRNY